MKELIMFNYKKLFASALFFSLLKEAICMEENSKYLPIEQKYKDKIIKLVKTGGFTKNPEDIKSLKDINEEAFEFVYRRDIKSEKVPYIIPEKEYAKNIQWYLHTYYINNKLENI
jgi:hypothetical protein